MTLPPSNVELPALRVALIGHGFMGAAHSHAWRNVASFFGDVTRPEMVVLVGRNEGAVVTQAEQWGWQESSTDWSSTLTRDDIDVVDIVTPGNLHAEIALRALAAGKHVLCEKPLANSVAEAQQMAIAADEARQLGFHSMLGFTYRRLPATMQARAIIKDGKIGTVRQVNATYFQDWLADADTPMTWRLDRTVAGTGALGDLGSHIIDLAQFLTGELITSVSGISETVVHKRPKVAERRGLIGEAGNERGTVTVDDAAFFSARMTNDVIATFGVSRMAPGRKNSLRIEVYGSLGSVAFDLERLNELLFCSLEGSLATQGETRILVTEPVHPYMAAWWPPGHVIGYEHGFVHQTHAFLSAIYSGAAVRPSFADGLQVQKVVEAVETSSRNLGQWANC